MNDALRKRLEAIVTDMPPGSAVTLPVDWLRQLLDAEGLSEVDDGSPGRPLRLQEVAERYGRSPSTIRGMVRGRKAAWCLQDERLRLVDSSLGAQGVRGRPAARSEPRAGFGPSSAARSRFMAKGSGRPPYLVRRWQHPGRIRTSTAGDGALLPETRTSSRVRDSTAGSE